MRRQALIVAAALAAAPLGAHGADLVVWWQEGYYPQADEAVAEIITAFRHHSGKEVDLVQPTEDEMFDQVAVALRAGHPPDFFFHYYAERWVAQWAYEGRLLDLRGALGSTTLDLFDADTLDAVTLLNGATGQRGLYALPMGRASNHVHVWSGLLERAGFAVADIPKDWAAFWSFWCDEVQPAVRRTLGRDDVWGVGLPMSAAANDTADQFVQFLLAYEAPWLGDDRRLQVDDHAVRTEMVEALEDYTEIWRKSCTPPESARWANGDNNRAFLDRSVVMTLNPSLSIPAALRTKSRDDYYDNALTIDWPDGANDQPLVIIGSVIRAVIFKDGDNPALAADFEEGWLAHWLTFAGDQFLPPMRKLVEQPFWLDTSDPHRLRATVQILTRPHFDVTMGPRDNEWRSSGIFDENVWGNAVHRVVTDDITPEQGSTRRSPGSRRS